MSDSMGLSFKSPGIPCIAVWISLKRGSLEDALNGLCKESADFHPACQCRGAEEC